MSSTLYRDYRPEVRDLVAQLTRDGFTVVAVDDGGDRETNDLTPERIAEIVTGVDEAWVFVQRQDIRKLDGVTPRTLTLYLVLGNEPGVIVADHSDIEPLCSSVQAHADAWEDREQPMR